MRDRRAVAGALAAMLALMTLAGTANADSGGPPPVRPVGEDTVVLNPMLPGSPSSSSGSASSVHCDWFVILGDEPGEPPGLQLVPDPAPPVGSLRWAKCYRGGAVTVDGPMIVPDPGAYDPRILPQRALERLFLPLPAIGINPDRRTNMVSLPTWLWIENWSPVPADASTPNGDAYAVAVATPVEVEWSMGNGDSKRCGAGTPYDPQVPADEQESDCTYTYRVSSAREPGRAFQVTATVSWSITWTATSPFFGTISDTIGPVPVSDSITVRVAEGQAVVVDDR